MISEAGPPNPEKSSFVDQREAARWERVRRQIDAAPRLFARQGTVVAGWRWWRGRRLGPYYRLAYRDAGRQRSIYLGRSESLAGRVRAKLDELQGARRRRRRFARLIAQTRSSLRIAKARLQRQLAAWGIQLKGFEFRGVRSGMARYMEAGNGRDPLGAITARIAQAIPLPPGRRRGGDRCQLALSPG